MTIQPILPKYRQAVDAYVRYFWGGPMMVTKGELYDTRMLPGFVAQQDDALLGGALYRLVGDTCEVAALFSLVQKQGIATKLMDAVKHAAIGEGAKTLWLITTNDNVPALSLYQKMGFKLTDVRIGAFEETRRLKGEFAQTGYDGILIEHEMELTMALDG